MTYGINPIHLGIIFLANLELGYLTPPVGLNLQFAAYRFNRLVSALIRDVAPFLLVLLAAVLLITYLPAMTTLLLDVFHFSGASSGQTG
jgi:C4-dicarboxylate transporter DctM subunit